MTNLKDLHLLHVVFITLISLAIKMVCIIVKYLDNFVFNTTKVMCFYSDFYIVFDLDVSHIFCSISYVDDSKFGNFQNKIALKYCD